MMWINLISALFAVLILSCSNGPGAEQNEVKPDSTSAQQQHRFIEAYPDSTQILRKRLKEFGFLLKDGMMLTTADWTTRGGIWDFSDSIYYAQGTQTKNKAYYNKTDFSDFIFDVKMTKLTEDGSFGLIFHYDERLDNGYTFEVYPHGGYIFGYYHLGARKTIAGETIKKFNRSVNAWNTIKIKCKGDQYSFYINNYLLASHEERHYGRGRIGLYVGGGPRQQARFRVLQIKKLK